MELFFTQMESPSVKMTAALQCRDWQPVHLPFREALFFDHVPVMDLSPFKAIIMTSKNAVRWFLERQFPQPWPEFALVGGGTAQHLGTEGVRLMVPPAPHGEALVKTLRPKVAPQDPLLFLHGARVAPHIPQGFMGYNLMECTVYETRKIVPNKALRPASGMVYFQAPSSVEDFVELYDFRPQHIAVIGPSTRKRVEQEGWRVDFQPSRPELEVFLRELPHHTNFKG